MFSLCVQNVRVNGFAPEHPTRETEGNSQVHVVHTSTCLDALPWMNEHLNVSFLCKTYNVETENILIYLAKFEDSFFNRHESTLLQHVSQWRDNESIFFTFLFYFVCWEPILGPWEEQQELLAPEPHNLHFLSYFPFSSIPNIRSYISYALPLFLHFFSL